MITRNQIKEYKRLNQKKFRNQSDVVLVEGKRVIEQILSYGILPQVVFIEENSVDFKNILLKKDRHLINYVKYNTIAELSETKNPQEIIAIFKKPRHDFGKTNQKGNYVYLDDIRDPGNLGTIFRTCLALGIDGIYLSPNSCEVYSPKVIRSSLGSIFLLPFDVRELKDIKLKNCDIFSAEMSGETVESVNEFNTSMMIVIGNEANGVSEEVSKQATKKISIPMNDKMESLNASVACSIIVHHLLWKKNAN